MKVIKSIFLLAAITWSIQMNGQSQYALSFDGVDDYVNLGTDPSLNITGSITIEVWLYLSSPQAQYRRYVVKEWETSYNLGVGATVNSVLFGMAPNANFNNTLQTSSGVTTTNQWNHIVGTWDGDTLRIFVNGEEKAKKAWVNNSVVGTSFPTLLGTDQLFNSNRFFSGTMDELRIWNVARTQQEIRDNMYRELVQPDFEPNLVAYYRFNEGSGQTSADLSINNNTAILGGTTNIEASDPTWVMSFAPIPYYTVTDGDWDQNTVWAPQQLAPFKSWARAVINNEVNIPLNTQMNEIRISFTAALSLNPGFELNINDIFEIEANGSFKLNDNTTLFMGQDASLLIAEDGILKSHATFGNDAMITGAGYYSFDVLEGGTLSAAYTIFEYMDVSGVNITGEVDLLNPLDYCTFQNGEPGGTLITFSGNEPATLTNVHFPANTWGSLYNVSKLTDQGEIEFIDATGAFAGETYEFDPFDLIEWEGLLVEIKVILEGPFSGTEMEASLNPVLPLTQPYSANPWNYSGPENVPAIPFADIVDWILVELRDAPDAVSATPVTTIATKAAFINNLGEIVDLDGLSPLRFGNTISNELFVVVKHRNHLDIMSAVPLTKVGGSYSYDFSNAGTQAYGDGNGYKEIAPGIWGMVSGDANADGIIDEDDKTLSWNSESGTSGYLQSDVNLDGQSNNIDKNDFWFFNDGKFSQVPD